MKNAVRVEIVSLLIFISSFFAVGFSGQIAYNFLWITILLSYLCFLVEFAPKRKAHPIVALEHGTFGFFFYLLAVPVLYLSNHLTGWPDNGTIRLVMLVFLLPVAVSKFIVVLTSVRRFDSFRIGWLAPIVIIPFLPSNLYLLLLVFCVTIFVSTTTILRSHDYLRFNGWVSVSTMLFFFTSIFGLLIIPASDIYYGGVVSVQVFTLLFLFESVLSVKYRSIKDEAVQKLKKSGLSLLAKEIEHRYNLSLTLLALDLSIEKKDIKALGIARHR